MQEVCRSTKRAEEREVMAQISNLYQLKTVHFHSKYYPSPCYKMLSHTCPVSWKRQLCSIPLQAANGFIEVDIGRQENVYANAKFENIFHRH